MSTRGTYLFVLPWDLQVAGDVNHVVCGLYEGIARRSSLQPQVLQNTWKGHPREDPFALRGAGGSSPRAPSRPRSASVARITQLRPGSSMPRSSRKSFSSASERSAIGSSIDALIGTTRRASLVAYVLLSYGGARSRFRRGWHVHHRLHREE